MTPTPFPKVVFDDLCEISLECYSLTNREELWLSIQADRQHPKRNGIWPGMDSLATLSSYMDECDVSQPHSKEMGYIVRNSFGQLVGTFHVFEISWADRTAELGYGLHHQFTGHGLATKVVMLMERRLLQMGFDCLRIRCQEWNAKSWAVAERAGYRMTNRTHKNQICLGCDDCTRFYEKRFGKQDITG